MVRFAHSFESPSRHSSSLSRPTIELSDEHYDLVRQELTTLATNSFSDGYSRAIADQFAALIWHTEQFLNDQPDASDAQRRLIYRFVEHMQNRIAEMAKNSGYVEDGLGI